MCGCDGVGYQLWLFYSLSKARLDPVNICAQLNPYVLKHYTAHAILVIFLLFGGMGWWFVINVPLAGWRGWEFYKKQYLFNPTAIGPAKGHAGNATKSVYIKLGGAAILYIIMQIFFLIKLFF